MLYNSLKEILSTFYPCHKNEIILPEHIQAKHPEFSYSYHGQKMAYNENMVTLEHDGQKYNATYTVDGGVVSVMMKDNDGMERATSTFVDGTTIDTVARRLLRELLKDLGLS